MIPIPRQLNYPLPISYSLFPPIPPYIPHQLQSTIFLHYNTTRYPACINDKRLRTLKLDLGGVRSIEFNWPFVSILKIKDGRRMRWEGMSVCGILAGIFLVVVIGGGFIVALGRRKDDHQFMRKRKVHEWEIEARGMSVHGRWRGKLNILPLLWMGIGDTERKSMEMRIRLGGGEGDEGNSNECRGIRMGVRSSRSL